MYRIASSYGDVYYVVAGVLWERVGDDGLLVVMETCTTLLLACCGRGLVMMVWCGCWCR